MDGHEKSTEPRARKKRNRKGKPIRWGAGLALAMLLGALLWFAPAIIANTSLRQWAITRATGELPVTVNVDRLSLGWLSPIIVHSLTVHDEAGDSLLDVHELRISQPLYRLALDRTRLGTIRIDHPHLYLRLRDDGSNLEDVLRPLLEAEAKSPIPDISLEVIDGVVELSNTSTRDRWLLDHCHGDVQLAAEGGGDLLANLRGEVHSASLPMAVSGAGTFLVELRWPMTGGEEADGRRDAHLRWASDALPSELLAPLAARFLGDVHFSGSLTSDCEVALQGDTRHVRIRKMDWRNASLHAPAWIGGDQPRIARVALSGALQHGPAGLRVDELVLQSDAMAVRVHGTMDAVPHGGTSSHSPAASLMSMLEASDFEASGEIDLARLSALLPATLHVRQGTEITSGKLVASLASHRQGNVQRWEGRVESSDLAAQVQNQRIVWRQPLQVDFAARNSADGPVIERLVGTADFFRVEGQGTAAAGSLDADANLDRLVKELSRFIDLGETRLSGTLTGAFDWRRENETDLVVSGNAVVGRFVLAAPNLRPWQEQRLEVKLTGRGSIGKNTLTRIDAVQLVVQSGDDRLDAQLTKPVMQFSTATAWPIRATLAGELERWLARVQTLAPLDGWTLQGSVQGEAVASLSPRFVQIESAKAAIDDWVMTGPGLHIREPKARGEFMGTWDATASRIQSQATVFQSTAVSFRASDVDLRFGTEQPSYQGTASFQGHLDRFSRWFQEPQSAAARQIRGSAIGNVQLTHADGITRARGQTDLRDFALLRARSAAPQTGVALAPVAHGDTLETLWSEPQLTVRGDASWNHARDEVDAHSLEVAASAVNVRAAGRIRQPATAAIVNVTGEIDYDLPKLAERIRGYLGPDIRVTGAGTRAFRLEGPLWDRPIATAVSTAPATAGQPRRRDAARVALVSHELRGQAALGWDSVTAFGLQVGRGEIDARLANAIVQMEPLEMPVSEGRLTLHPRIDLYSPSPTLMLPQGPLVDNVRLSPELCQTWFKYIAPLLADATSAEGRFSVALDGARVPLDDAAAGAARGTLRIHSGRVGPGPLSRELLGVAQQVRAVIARRPLSSSLLAGDTWVALPEQEVGFEWKDQRMNHNGLSMTVRDMVIRTHGSVGFDQSLSLMAEIPIRDEWLSGEPLLAGLRGQVVRIPIHGSVNSPRVDARALEQFGKQIARDAAGKVLEGEIQRGIKRLFGQ